MYFTVNVFFFPVFRLSLREVCRQSAQVQHTKDFALRAHRAICMWSYEPFQYCCNCHVCLYNVKCATQLHVTHFCWWPAQLKLWLWLYSNLFYLECNLSLNIKQRFSLLAYHCTHLDLLSCMLWWNCLALDVTQKHQIIVVSFCWNHLQRLISSIHLK